MLEVEVHGSVVPSYPVASPFRRFRDGVMRGSGATRERPDVATTDASRPAAPSARDWSDAGRRPRAGWYVVVATAAVLLSVPLAVGFGSADVRPAELLEVLRATVTGTPAQGMSQGVVNIVWELRLPRVLLAGIVGASLAVVGVAMQALARNALADPYILGVSSGASVGAAAVILFGGFGLLGVHALTGGAFVGACAAMAVVYLIARVGGPMSPLRLVLGGVAMGYVFSALTSLLVVLGDPRATQSVMFWLLGGFGRARWAYLPVPGLALLVCTLYLLLRARWLNAISVGEETAATLGVNVARFRLALFVITALVTAVAVAVSGAIGFVGLILPHLVRLLVGAEHTRVLALAPPLGAVFMIWVDVIARTVIAPQSLPVGVITALLGGPVFVLLLVHRARTLDAPG